MTLDEIEAAVWAQLAASVEDGPYRALTLASVAASGGAAARMVILRGVAGRVLEIHTDIRSAKWGELAVTRGVTLLGYDPEARWQLRLAGDAACYGPGTDIQSGAWDALSPWTRTTYCGGPPGHVQAAPPEMPDDPAATEVGSARFGVVRIAIETLDWYQHPRGAIRRARFAYDGEGRHHSADWVRP